MKTVFAKRLIRFAEHLQTIEDHPENGILKLINIIAVTNNKRIDIEVICHHWVFDALVDVFPNVWGWSSKTGDPILEYKEPNGETAECVFEFFGIKDYEVFCHFFELTGYQRVDKWGGQILTTDSMGPQIARNILEYVKRLH